MTKSRNSREMMDSRPPSDDDSEESDGRGRRQGQAQAQSVPTKE